LRKPSCVSRVHGEGERSAGERAHGVEDDMPDNAFHATLKKPLFQLLLLPLVVADGLGANLEQLAPSGQGSSSVA